MFIFFLFRWLTVSIQRRAHIWNYHHKLLGRSQLKNSSKYNYYSYEKEETLDCPVSCFLGWLLFLYLHIDQYMKPREEILSSEEFCNSFRTNWNFDVLVVQINPNTNNKFTEINKFHFLPAYLLNLCKNRFQHNHSHLGGIKILPGLKLSELLQEVAVLRQIQQVCIYHLPE